MAAFNQITGGGFQDVLGNPLAQGYLVMQLSADAKAPTSLQLGRGKTYQIPLDNSGNVSGTISVWANDALTPSNTYYIVTAFSSTGQRVWGPYFETVESTPSPFDITAWVPTLVDPSA